MSKKPNPILDQIETMQMILVAEELRQKAAMARGEVTQDQAKDHLAKVRAVLTTLEWIRDNRASLVADELRAGR